jgi:DNA-binding CsgD family transcriptional regulator
MPASLPGAQRARVTLEYATAAGLVDHGEELIDLARRARDEALAAGDPVLAADALVKMLIGVRREGHPAVERRDLARRILVEIEPLPATPAREQVRLDALQELGFVEMDEHHLAEARARLEEALEIAGQQGLASDSLAIQLNLASVDVMETRVAEGMDRLHALADEAREIGDEIVAVTAYRDAAIAGVRALDYRQAGLQLQDGLRYADAQDQMHCGHVMISTAALVAWADGRWDEAFDRGRHALADRGSGRSRAIAELALGYVALSRGDPDGASAHLRAAVHMGEVASWLDVILPGRWGLAEARLAGGDPSGAAADCEAAVGLARRNGEWGLVAPFAVTGVRAFQLAGQPEAADRFLGQVVRAIGPATNIAEPALRHARGLVQLAEGAILLARESFEAAVAGWDARGRRWEALWARLDLAAAQLRTRRFAEAVALVDEVRAEAERLAAPALLARVNELSRQARGHSTTLEPWHPLSSREFEVARAIAEGKTNPEVAEELGISPKTASSHVEHILAKLGATRRAEIAAWATSVMATR